MPDTIIEVSQYKGQKSLMINCTQLGDSFTPQYKTAKQKRAVLDEWCDFLRSEQDAFDELSALPNLKTGLLKERAEIYKKR